MKDKGITISNLTEFKDFKIGDIVNIKNNPKFDNSKIIGFQVSNKGVRIIVETVYDYLIGMSWDWFEHVKENEDDKCQSDI